MSRLRRAARQALRRGKERLSGDAPLVGLVRPEAWTTEAHLDALRAVLMEVSPTSLLLVGRGDDDPAEGCEPEHLLLRLEPDAQLDVARLRDALQTARLTGEVVIGAGAYPPGRLDPRDVIASARSWSAVGVTPHTATASDLLALVGSGYQSSGSFWTPGLGDGSLPLAEQRRFRPDLARQRTHELLDAFSRMQAGEVEWWRVWMLGAPVPGWLADAVGGGPSYLEELRPLVSALLDGLAPEALARVPVSARRASYAGARGSLDDLALLLDHDGDNPTGLPVTGGLVELPDGLSDDVAAMPEAWRRIEDVDRVSHAALVHAWHDGDVTHLLGVAWTDYTPGLVPDVQLGMGGTWLDTDVHPWEDDQVAVAVGRGHEDHGAAGFRIVAAAGTELSFIRVGTSGPHHVIDPDWVPDPPRGAAVVTGVEVRDGALRLTLDRTPKAATLTGPRGRAHEGSVDGDVLVLPLTATTFGAGGPLATGRYRVDGQEVAVPGALLADPPDLREGSLGVRLGVGPAGRLQVQVATALTTAERSARGQRLLRERAASDSPRRTVLLEAFHGRSAGDNVGPVADELHRLAPDLDLALVVDDPRLVPPAGVRGVVRRSGEWHELLRTSAAYVANAGAPAWWSKPAGQVHLQTWHGTPLKRISADRGPGDLSVWRHRRDVSAQAADWDAMVSANPLSSRAFGTAFGFRNELLETGYPRNDVLLDPARRDAARAEVRAALGIGEQQRVVLYAPTWREYVGVRDAKPLYLEAPALTAAVPDAVVLVRGHYNATGSPDAYAGEQRVVDVTRYPDIAPLFCAADVLVTDYSSVMFDFVLLDRPVVLLTPDLEQYRDVERGFYFDLESRPPGDLVRTTDEVVERLTGPDTGAAARAAFREEFCPWDDGHAAERVARWLLERLA